MGVSYTRLTDEWMNSSSAYLGDVQVDMVLVGLSQRDCANVKYIPGQMQRLGGELFAIRINDAHALTLRSPAKSNRVTRRLCQ